MEAQTSEPVEVSVVIAAYNAVETIAEAIASALAQDVAVEVIVADDASQDDTRAVASGIEGVRLLTTDVNGGPGAARNRGFAAANGRWITVLDADDVMLEGRLARVLKKAEATGADIVIDNVIVERKGRRSPLFKEAALPPILDLATFINGNHPFTRNQSLGYANPLFSRAFLEAHRLAYDPTLRIGEDYLLFADALACGARCAVEPRAGYLYRRSEASISARLRQEHVAAMRAADERFRARHALDAAALAALANREAALQTAEAFIGSVDRLKEGQPLAALQAIARRPGAAWHYRYPVGKRFSLFRR